MSRRLTALKPQLNRIRAWAHEGSTDAWIAHQLETSAEAVRAFRQEHGIERGGPAPLAPITPDSVVEAMLAEDEAAAALAPDPGADEPAPEPPDEPASESAASPAPRRRTRTRKAAPADEAPDAEAEIVEEPMAAEEIAPAADAPARGSSRRRGARGGSGRGAAKADPEPQDEAPAAESPDAEPAGDDEPGRGGSARKRGRRRGRGRGAGRGLEARLLPGSVLLLDAAVTADASFQEHWQDAGPLRVEISADAIVLRRVTSEAEPDRPQP